MKKAKKGYRYGGMAGKTGRSSGMTRSNMTGNGYRKGGMAKMKGGSGSGMGRLQKSKMAGGSGMSVKRDPEKSGKVMTKRGYGAARKG